MSMSVSILNASAECREIQYQRKAMGHFRRTTAPVLRAPLKQEMSSCMVSSVVGSNKGA